MTEPTDAIGIVARAALDAPELTIHSLTAARFACRVLDALFDTAGIEGDGKAVLRREGDRVSVEGRLEVVGYSLVCNDTIGDRVYTSPETRPRDPRMIVDAYRVVAPEVGRECDAQL